GRGCNRRKRRGRAHQGPAPPAAPRRGKTKNKENLSCGPFLPRCALG
uniref:Uncharacterized protein n=1 Tax=Macaca fascicularis TaxID=9541 RepID=A0A7N9CUH8_MACFA